MKELDNFYDKKEGLLKQLGRVLYSTARASTAFNGGRPIETSSYKAVAGPRSGQISLIAGLHGKRLYTALNSSEMANLRALFAHIRGWSLESDPRVDWEGERLVIEASWPESMQLSSVCLSDIPVRANDGHTALLGLRQDYEFHVIRIDRKLNAHTLIVGTTGSGKTVTMTTIIVQLARAEDVQFVIIDGKQGDESLGDSLPGLKGLVGPVAHSMEDAIAAIKWVASELHLREIGEHSTETPCHVFVDEFQEFTTESAEFSKLAAKIGRLGRALNVHLHFGTQRPDAAMWGVAGGNLKSQFTRKILHKLNSHHDVATVTGSSSPPANRLCGCGDAYEISAKETVRVQVAMPTEEDIKRVTGFQPQMTRWPSVEEEADEAGQRFGALQIYASVYAAALRERDGRTGGRGTLQKILKGVGVPEPTSGIADDLLSIGRDIVERFQKVLKKEK